MLLWNRNVSCVVRACASCVRASCFIWASPPDHGCSSYKFLKPINVNARLKFHPWFYLMVEIKSNTDLGCERRSHGHFSCITLEHNLIPRAHVSLGLGNSESGNEIEPFSSPVLLILKCRWPVVSPTTWPKESGENEIDLTTKNVLENRNKFSFKPTKRRINKENQHKYALKKCVLWLQKVKFTQGLNSYPKLIQNKRHLSINFSTQVKPRGFGQEIQRCVKSHGAYKVVQSQRLFYTIRLRYVYS